MNAADAIHNVKLAAGNRLTVTLGAFCTLNARRIR